MLGTVEPLEDGHLAEITVAVGRDAATILVDGDAVEAEDEVEGRVPDGELVAPRWDVGDAELAVSVGGRGEEAFPRYTAGHFVEAHPRGGVTEASAVVEGVVRRPRHVLVDDGSADRSGASRRDRIELLDEADEDVESRGAELGEVRGLAGLDPGVDHLGALDGRGLLPAAVIEDAVAVAVDILRTREVAVRGQVRVARGRHRLDTVLPRRQILDGQPAVGAGDAGTTTQRVAEGVLTHDAGRGTITAAGVFDDDREAAHVGLAGADAGILGG